eukprot:1161220-Pelagomonas_calceolata.AAC.20
MHGTAAGAPASTQHVACSQAYELLVHCSQTTLLRNPCLMSRSAIASNKEGRHRDFEIDVPCCTPARAAQQILTCDTASALSWQA